MRATATAATPIRRTIDLTSASPRVELAPMSRRDRDALGRERAQAAFKSTRRARFTRGSIDTAADAAMATGGIVLANVSMKLNLGLPRGMGGITLGIALLAVGAAIALARRGRSGGTDPATAMTPARIIVLDDATARTVISLDLPAEQHQVA